MKMRKGIQKRKFALLLVGMFAITQMPTNYVYAEETNVIQEKLQVLYNNEVVANSDIVTDGEEFEIDGTTLIRYSGNASSITIPDGITSIGSYAFNCRKSLTSITIPASVTSIGDYAFNSCVNLSSIRIPDGVTSIGARAFQSCTSLASIEISNSVKSIGDYAFNACYGLTSITIPDGVTSIGNYAFNGNTSLNSIKISSSVTSIGDFAFEHCNKVTSVEISNGVKTIGQYAFHGCSSLKSITIPESIVSIGTYAFGDCDNLTSAIISQGVKSIGSYAFFNCTRLANVTIPEGVTSIGEGTFADCEIRKIKIPSSVTSIGDIAFSYCTKLSEIIISEGVTSIGRATFAGCAIKNINIPSSVTSIGDIAFSNCSKLSSITIPESVTFIGKDVFYGCSGNRVLQMKYAKGNVGSYFKIYCKTSSNAYKYAKKYKKCGITVVEYKNYKIKYKLNKGKNTTANPSNYRTGSTVKLANPTRKNYTFVGWYIGDEKVTSISKTTSGNVTLTAKWEKVSVAKTTVKSAKNNSAGKIKVTFNKVSGVKGYTIYYSTNKELKNATMVTVSSNKKTATFQGLEKGKTYYVTVKAYKLDSQGNKVYGKSNKTIKVKVTK